MLSQEILSQRSEARRIYERRIILSTSERGEQRCGSGMSYGQGGPGGYSNGAPCKRRTLLVLGDKDGGMADGADVNDNWGGTRCAGMAR